MSFNVKLNIIILTAEKVNVVQYYLNLIAYQMLNIIFFLFIFQCYRHHTSEF